MTPTAVPIESVLPPTVAWVPLSSSRVPGVVRIIDQTRLPTELVYKDLSTVDEVWHAIRTLQVRGAPAIGVAAAMGVVLGAQSGSAASTRGVTESVERACTRLATSRPTAVNLFWALDRMKARLRLLEGLPAPAALDALACEAQAICDEDIAMCRAIGRHALSLLAGVGSVLTHCNAGSLATARYGTALSPVYVAAEHGRRIRVFADETRPLLQGSRLTAWELRQAGVDVTVICDNMAAEVLRRGWVEAVLVGADRIAANGDTANKIGTYGLSVLAAAHGVPFYVLAPTSTFDLSLSSGAAIPIEERAPEEVTCGFGRRTAPEDVRVFSPAFDVTPARNIAAIICERGIARPDYTAQLAGLAAARPT